MGAFIGASYDSSVVFADAGVENDGTYITDHKELLKIGLVSQFEETK